MNIMQIIACVIIIVILISYLRKPKNKRFYELLERFPSYTKYPLIGNAHLLFGPLDGVLERFEKIFGHHDRLLFWLGSTPCLFFKNHEDIATVMNQSTDRDFLGTADEWIGLGILNARNEEWRKSRKMLTPAFSSSMLMKYTEVFERNSLDLVEKLKPVADSGKETDVWERLMKSTLDTVTETSFGVPIRTEGKIGEVFCISIHDAITLIMKRFQFPWLLLRHINMIYLMLIGKTNSIYNVQNYPTTVLKKSIKNFHDSLEDNNVPNDVDTSKSIIYSLIRYSLKEPSVTETRMRDELISVMGGSIETTPLSQSFLMLMLAMNQEIQQKAYAEVSKLATEDGTFLSYDVDNNMPYVEQCVKETLRMFNPVALNNRRVHKDIQLKDNVIVPANTIVTTFIHFASYDPELFKNPDKFDPEHFSEEAVKARPKTSQLSFGYGPRICLGAKYAMILNKTQIAYILLNYHLSTSIKEFTKKHIKMELSIKSRIGYPIKFTRRR